MFEFRVWVSVVCRSFGFKFLLVEEHSNRWISCSRIQVTWFLKIQGLVLSCIFLPWLRIPCGGYRGQEVFSAYHPCHTSKTSPKATLLIEDSRTSVVLKNHDGRPPVVSFGSWGDLGFTERLGPRIP